jgi:hypothetical protein
LKHKFLKSIEKIIKKVVWIIKILYLSPPKKNDFDGLNFISKIKYFFLARIKRICTFAAANREVSYRIENESS